MTAPAQIQPYWFSRPEQEIRAATEAREEAWAAVPGYRRYEWSDKCRVRRVSDGHLMSPRTLNSRYAGINVVRDDGKRVPVLVHVMILLAHHPAFCGLSEFPAGLETRHNPVIGDKTWNYYPEGLWPGTKGQNAADKDPQDPLQPCKNAPRCPNMNHNAGRRCADCLDAVGLEASELLRLGMPSLKVAARYGNSESWIMKLATERGGYGGTNAEARAQRPTVRQRLRLARRAARMGDPL